MGHSIGLTSGPLLTVLHEHKWQHMDRCLACSTLQLLVFVFGSIRGGLVLLCHSLAISVCVCEQCLPGALKPSYYCEDVAIHPDGVTTTP